jgi:hypothetical protein
LDLLLGLIREFGPTVGGVLVVIGMMGMVIKYQNTKLEKAYEARVEEIKLGNAETIKVLAADRDRGWQQAGIWQQQAERLAERYTEATQLAADMSDEVLQRRRRTPR